MLSSELKSCAVCQFPNRSTTSRHECEDCSEACATAEDLVFGQHATIAEAIRLLQADLEKMTDTINPSDATWRDVSGFAHVADAAREIVGRYAEWNK